MNTPPENRRHSRRRAKANAKSQNPAARWLREMPDYTHVLICSHVAHDLKRGEQLSQEEIGIKLGGNFIREDGSESHVKYCIACLGCTKLPAHRVRYLEHIRSNGRFVPVDECCPECQQKNPEKPAEEPDNSGIRTFTHEITELAAKIEDTFGKTPTAVVLIALIFVLERVIDNCVPDPTTPWIVDMKNSILALAQYIDTLIRLEKHDQKPETQETVQ